MSKISSRQSRPLPGQRHRDLGTRGRQRVPDGGHASSHRGLRHRQRGRPGGQVMPTSCRSSWRRLSRTTRRGWLRATPRASPPAGRLWCHASSCIEAALAQVDAASAVDALRGHARGIPNWQTAMASVVLAACRPKLYTVAESRALRTMMVLEGRPQAAIVSTRQFPRSRWEGYIAVCRELATELDVRLRDVDRAFWASAGLPASVA